MVTRKKHLITIKKQQIKYLEHIKGSLEESDHPRIHQKQQQVSNLTSLYKSIEEQVPQQET